MNKFDAVLKIVRAHKHFLISTHHNPDADALGSALAVAVWLTKIGKKVTVLNEDSCPSWLAFLPKSALLKKAAIVSKLDYDAALILDCGDLARVGGVSKLLQAGKPMVNIDHHITNDRFGSVNVVEVKASSTCEIIFDLLKSAKFKLNNDIAQLLYAGIMTDTGSFRFENTTAKTHAIAAELMSFKVSAPQMYNKLYVGVPVIDMKRFADVIHEAQLLMGNKVYCVSLPKKVTAKFSKSFDLKEKLFSFLRMVEGIEVVVILTELSGKEVRVNFRSQGPVDVARLAAQFSGGGHIKAAGCKVQESLPSAKKTILTAVRKVL